MATVEVLRHKPGFAQYEIVGNEYACDGTEEGRVAYQPSENIVAVAGEQFPGLDQLNLLLPPVSGAGQTDVVCRFAVNVPGLSESAASAPVKIDIL